MKDRCLNKRGDMYKDYGARGITVCDRWRDSFEAFLEDMGPRPSRKHELDRRDNEGPYSAENCQWSTKHEQANNKRNNILVTVGADTMTVAQWGRKMGVSDFMIHKRLKRGWAAEEAVMTPPSAMRKWHRKPSVIVSAGVRRGGSTAQDPTV